MKSSCVFSAHRTCPLDWATLVHTRQEKQRYCGSCRKIVYIVNTEDQYLDHAAKGDCIAVFLPDSQKVSLPIWFGEGRVTDYQRSDGLTPSADDEL